MKWPVIIVICFLALTVHALDPGLTVSKAVYEQKLQAADLEKTSRQNDLNSWYSSTLKTLLRAKQDKGELEPVLAIKGEGERFAKEGTVTGANVVSFPAELAQAQRAYLDSQDKVNQDRQLKIARAARGYLDDLEPTKRSLTRIGELDAAVAVNEEIKRVKESVDLSVLEKPAVVAAKPVTPPAAQVTAPAPVVAAVSAVVVNPPGLRPLRDDVWVYALRNGVPERNVSFMFVPTGAGKTVELRTDQMGKIALRAEEATRYHIAIVSDKYEFLHVENASAGNTYQFKITDAAPGSGVAYIKDKDQKAYLPGIGQVTLGKWRSPEGKTGFTFFAGSPVFRQQQNPTRMVPTVTTRFGDSFRIVDGNDEYEATLYRIGPGDTSWLHYRKVEKQ